MPSSLVIRMCAIEALNEGARRFTDRKVLLVTNPCVRGKLPVTHGPPAPANPAWYCPAHLVYQQSESPTKAASCGRFLKVRSNLGLRRRSGRSGKFGHQVDTAVWITT